MEREKKCFRCVLLLVFSNARSNPCRFFSVQVKQQVSYLIRMYVGHIVCMCVIEGLTAIDQGVS